MVRQSVFPRAAVAAATLFVVACSGDGVLAPPGVPGPLLDETGEVIQRAQVEPNYGVYRSAQARGDAVQASTLGTRGVQPLIRVGVVEGRSAVHLGATGAWVLHDRADGVQLLAGSTGGVVVTLASAPETNFRLQVVCGSASAVSTRKAAVEAAGFETATEFVPAANCTRLYLGKFASNASFGIRNAFRNRMISLGFSGTDSFWKLVTFGASTYRVAHDGSTFVSANPVVLSSTDGGLVTIGTTAATARRYRGVAIARMNSAGTVAGIDELPMEEYLYGVVPRELGPIAYPEIEAQKAQAVAARTYAMAGLGKRASDGYDLRATTSDQVYGGQQDEHPISTGAVDATAGIVARYDGRMISALYSSASGGHTADNDEAFAGAAVPYLRGVPDAQRGRALEHVPTLAVFRASANPTSLRNAAGNAFESDWSSRHRWSFEWTADEISDVLSAWHGSPVGRVLSIDVTERGPSGRVIAIAYVTEAGTFTHQRDAIRSSLRYVTATGAKANLWSTLFFVEPVTRGGKPTGGFRVYGGGFGHGVGMSQTGAVGMAQKGATFDRILTHYYQGITLELAY